MRARERALAGGGVLLGGLAVALPLFLPPGEAWPRTGAFRAALLLGALGVVAGIALESSRRARSRLAPLRLSPAGVWLLVALPVYLLLLGNGATLSTGDSQALRWLPSRLLTAGTLDLARTPAFRDDPEHYSAVASGSRLFPMAPPGTALVVLPHAAAAILASGGTVTPALIERWEKHAAALLVAVSAAFLFLTARRTLPDPASLATASVFALATPAFTTAGQALFPATGELFAVCLALFLLPSSPAPSRSRAAASGLAAALAFFCRPTAVIAGAGLLALVAARRKGEASAFGVAAAAGLAASAGFLLVLHGHPLGAYGRVNLAPEAWTLDVAHGLAGVLLSPSRGLLVFFPYLLLAPAAFRATRADAALRRLWLVSLGVTAGFVLLSASYAKWWGGHGIGPRLLVAASPFLALLAAPLFGPAAEGTARVGALLLAAGSAATQVVAAGSRGAVDWSTLVDVDGNPAVLWSLRDSQLAAAWTPGWRPSRVAPAPATADAPAPAVAPVDLQLLGSVDEPRPGTTVRGTLVVFGWARAEGEDLSVRVLLDGEDRTPRDVERLPRPDVAAAFPGLGDASRAGFLFRVPMRAGDAGTRRLDLRFRARDGRERLYPGPAFTWKP